MSKRQSNKIKVTERQIRDIFILELNTGSCKPKKSHCKICHAYEIANEQLTAELQSNYNIRPKNKTATGSLKYSDKEL